MIKSLIALVAVVLAGGCLPLVVRWSQRQLHAALALSTGIFLGAVFLHLLPSIAQLELDVPTVSVTAEPEPHDHGSNGHQHEAEPTEPTEAAAGAHRHTSSTIWFFVLLGVVGVYLVEGLFLRTHDHGDLHRHRSVSYATLLGVTVHSLTNGFGLGAAEGDAHLRWVFLVAIVAHKGFEAFSLTTVFQLAEFKRLTILCVVAAFALVTPLGVWIGTVAASSLDEFGLAVAIAVATGTFLYVCLSELLPEVFHHREDVLLKLALMAGGVGIMAILESLGT